MATYSVKHKTSGLFFGGFNEDQSVKWVAQEQAMKIIDTFCNIIGGVVIAITGFAIVYAIYAVLSGAWLS